MKKCNFILCFVGYLSSYCNFTGVIDFLALAESASSYGVNLLDEWLTVLILFDNIKWLLAFQEFWELD